MTAFTDSLMSRVEDAGLNASAPPQQRWMDGWLLRYLPGKARRARCINALAPGRLPLADKLVLAAQVYREAELPVLFRMTRFSQPPGLDDELARQGFRQVDTTDVLIRPNREPLAPRPLPDDLRWTPLDAPAFAQAVGELRGSPSEHRASHALRLQHSPVAYHGYAICRQTDGAVVACGQFAREAELVGLYDVFTHEDSRGQGLASLLCERLLSISESHGAKIAYLQVESQNHPALKVYARLGFDRAYSYHYREQEPG